MPSTIPNNSIARLLHASNQVWKNEQDKQDNEIAHSFTISPKKVDSYEKSYRNKRKKKHKIKMQPLKEQKPITHSTLDSLVKETSQKHYEFKETKEYEEETIETHIEKEKEIWWRNSHASVRKKIYGCIISTLANKPTVKRVHGKRLPLFAKKLEKFLYFGAQSLNEYLDERTIHDRIQKIAVRALTKKLKEKRKDLNQ